MEIKKNLLAKDLRFFTWWMSFRQALIGISPAKALKKREPRFKDLPDSWDFGVLLQDKGLSSLNDRNSGRVLDVWSQHFSLLLNLEFFAKHLLLSKFWNTTGYVVKDGVLPLEITEKRPKDPTWTWFEEDEYDHVLQKAGSEFLQQALHRPLEMWFALPWLINQLYKYSLENNQSTELEEIFLKAWLEIPSVIDESYTYSRFFIKETHLNLHNELDLSFKDLAEFPGFLVLDYSSLKMALVNDNVEDLTPYTQEFLKVCPKIPFHLQEYLVFFKLSLKNKDYESEFYYFFKLLNLKVTPEVLTNTKISNETWKLLMYNTPFPLNVFNQIDEERRKREAAAEIGPAVFGKDQPGSLIFNLYNLAKAKAAKSEEDK